MGCFIVCVADSHPVNPKGCNYKSRGNNFLCLRAACQVNYHLHGGFTRNLTKAQVKHKLAKARGGYHLAFVSCLEAFHLLLAPGAFAHFVESDERVIKVLIYGFFTAFFGFLRGNIFYDETTLKVE